MPHIILNVIWQNQIIGEIKLSFGDYKANTYAERFLNSLANAETAEKLKHLVYQ